MPEEKESIVPSRRQVRALQIIGVLTVLSLWSLVFLPPSYQTWENSVLTEVGILKPVWNQAIWYFAPICCFVLLVASSIYWRKKLSAYYALCALVAVTLLPLGFCNRVLHSLGPWVVWDSIHEPDGKQYAFLTSEFMQGQTLVMGRLRTSGILYTKFDALGDTNGDDPRSYAVLVRTSGGLEYGYGRLLKTSDDVLLGLRHDNHCYFAYDLNMNKFIGRDDIEAMSPFVLIAADSRLHKPDVDSVLKHHEWFRSWSESKPPEWDALLAAREHENEAVRELAKKIIALYEPDP